MKVAILAGGLGTRLAEETETRPKPMVEIGGKPILWHIMQHYGRYGFKEFFVALGYRGDVIKRFFLDHHTLSGDIAVDLASGRVTVTSPAVADWNVHLIETGETTSTGGRIKRLEPLLGTEPFMVTYGDGVSNIPLDALIAFHRRQGRLATVTAVRPPARFGGIMFDGDLVKRFIEKSQIQEGWINGGFMVLEPGVFQYLSGDESILEIDLLERLANEGQLSAFRHEGFWQCMDTLRDKRQLESLWQTGNPPWKTW
ncbi:MAG: glucose-1-phosphate cytidylyltransferase [Betaproteobacteria bacterium]|nr:glucose-1-phosphate cytidylyltransferase [Betaproteobacteria bacterium]